MAASGIPYPFSFVPQTAAITASASGDNTIVAGVANKRIYVLAYKCLPASAVTMTWKSGSSGAVTGAMPFAGTGNPTADGAGFNPAGWFGTTVAGDALILNLSSGVAVTGHLTYAVL